MPANSNVTQVLTTTFTILDFGNLGALYRAGIFGHGTIVLLTLTVGSGTGSGLVFAGL